MRADVKNDNATIDILSGINPTNKDTSPCVLIYALPMVCMFVGVLSGIRLPNIWSMTLYLFDYNFGFSKRGLIGTILSYIFTPPLSYWVLSGVALFIFAIMLIMLWLLYIKLIHIEQNIYLIQLLFFTSMGFVFLCHEIGYYDQVGLIVAITCILLPVDARSIILRLVLISIALLVHEAFLILFLPAVIFDIHIKSVSGGSAKSIFTPIAIVLIAVGVVVVISIIGKFDVDRREEFIAYLSTKASDFVIRRDAVQINFRGLTENFLVNYPLWANPGRNPGAVFHDRRHGATGGFPDRQSHRDQGRFAWLSTRADRSVPACSRRLISLRAQRDCLGPASLHRVDAGDLVSGFCVRCSGCWQACRRRTGSSRVRQEHRSVVLHHPVVQPLVGSYPVQRLSSAEIPGNPDPAVVCRARNPDRQDQDHRRFDSNRVESTATRRDRWSRTEHGGERKGKGAASDGDHRPRGAHGGKFGRRLDTVSAGV